MSEYQKYRKESDFASTFIAFFTSMFFAMLLSGFILLLVVRWYVRQTVMDVKAATDIYMKHKPDRSKQVD